MDHGREAPQHIDPSSRSGRPGRIGPPRWIPPKNPSGAPAIAPHRAIRSRLLSISYRAPIWPAVPADFRRFWQGRGKSAIKVNFGPNYWIQFGVRQPLILSADEICIRCHSQNRAAEHRAKGRSGEAYYGIGSNRGRWPSGVSERRDRRLAECCSERIVLTEQ
jgi:hypothetical protein